MAQQEIVIQDLLRKRTSFTREALALTIKSDGKGPRYIPYRQVICVDFEPTPGLLTLAYLFRKKETDPLTLVKIEGRYQGSDTEVVAAWAESLMAYVYEDSGIQRRRRLKVFVNPHGGVRKGASVFSKTVEPIFRAAQCPLDIIQTTHQGHAFDIAKDLALDYDAIITVSGDGLVHEVMNGFAHHKDPKKAFSIPIAPIPTGSGNGLSLNLLGLERGFDVTEAALNVIKGKHMKVDLFSLTQNGKRTISFMSQALGLMADLDIGTENLRWMGDTRFMVGLLRGVIQFKPCPVQLSYKVAESDKMKMANDLNNLQALRNSQLQVSTPPVASGGLPPLNHLPDDTEGWTTYDQPLLFVYAGKGPFVGRDYMAFPVSQPDDGLIDVMAQPVSSRTEILSSLGGAAKGDTYWQPSLHYIKAHAYRVKPLSPKGALAVDGEIFPFEEYQVEVHQKLATLLSPYGYYAANFSAPRSSKVLPGSKKRKGNESHFKTFSPDPVGVKRNAEAISIEREANIARNRALLEELELKQAVAGLGIAAPSTSKSVLKAKARPVQPKKRAKKEIAEVEADLELLRAQEAEERLVAEERARMASRPRQHDLDLAILLGEEEQEEIPLLAATLQGIAQKTHPRRVADPEAFTYDGDNAKQKAEVVELRERLQSMKIVSRAKVTQDRVYSAAYHPEVAKDIIFFGDKHGQLGIWDARAPPDEVADEDGESQTEAAEGGKYWRLQAHWPATSKSSISSIKMDPVNAHNVYTSSYDCSIRSLSFETGISRQVYATGDGTLISSIDLSPTGNEMWISDTLGGLTHLDLREDASRTSWYGLSEQKIGCISLNPTRPNFLLTASNNRLLRIWDSRKLTEIAAELSDAGPEATGLEYGTETVNQWINTKRGKGCLRAEWHHNKSVSSAYWDPRGRSIVSTSYDDKLRLWEMSSELFTSTDSFPSSRPFSQLTHDCQTGKWLTILRAQWSPNPDVYPHFTIGNMKHSLDIFSCKGDLVARLVDREK
ncbi:hypothetical protein C0991_003873 [Blastosporella zonata]|nr:hypothetical protein C0991_003873 [Blastosporella zonata]